MLLCYHTRISRAQHLGLSLLNNPRPGKQMLSATGSSDFSRLRKVPIVTNSSPCPRVTMLESTNSSRTYLQTPCHSQERLHQHHVQQVKTTHVLHQQTLHTHNTVGFHNFNLRNFNLRVSNPDKFIVDAFLTRCRISMCQGLGPKNTMKFRKSTVYSYCQASQELAGSRRESSFFCSAVTLGSCSLRSGIKGSSCDQISNT